MKLFSGERENLGMVGGRELDLRANKPWWFEGVYTVFEVDPEFKLEWSIPVTESTHAMGEGRICKLKPA